MVKRVRISADSTCDLSRAQVEQHHIQIHPLYVNLGDQSFRDGVNIHPEEIYHFFETTGKLPTTSAVTVGEYLDAFRALTRDDGELVHINLSSEFSCCYQNACIAASELEGVYVVDSKNLSTGSGHLVLEAAEMAEAGLSGAEIKQRLDDLAGRVRASFVIDNLLYLHKGGRCSSVAALGANLLKLKPCIEVQNGRMEVGKKYRGKYATALLEYVKDKLSDARVRDKRIFIPHTRTDPELVELVRRAVADTGLFQEIIETEAGCTITAHCGPNTLGILFIEEE